MNKLIELINKGGPVIIGRHDNGLGFFIQVGHTSEGTWDGSSHGHILEETVENALYRLNGEEERIYPLEDFEIGRHS